MTEREDGHYWVQVLEAEFMDTPEHWCAPIIGWWYDGSWSLIGSDICIYGDGEHDGEPDLRVVSPRIVEPTL